MIRDQMLFIDCKKFHFKKNIPSNETKHFGIDYRNEALIPWFNISENRLFGGLENLPVNFLTRSLNDGIDGFFFYKSVIGHGSILYLIQKKCPIWNVFVSIKVAPFPLHLQEHFLIYCMLYLGMWYSSFLFFSFSSILFHR
jgi:hypothetical protein